MLWIWASKCMTLTPSKRFQEVARFFFFIFIHRKRFSGIMTLMQIADRVLQNCHSETIRNNKLVTHLMTVPLESRTSSR